MKVLSIRVVRPVPKHGYEEEEVMGFNIVAFLEEDGATLTSATMQSLEAAISYIGHEDRHKIYVEVEEI